jgi:hypothetical protein
MEGQTMKGNYSVKNQNFPRYIAPNFLQYLCERPNKSKQRSKESCPLEAVNGVPGAVDDEVVPAVKGEPVVAVRVKLKWSAHSFTASDHK